MDLRQERSRDKKRLRYVLKRDGAFCHWCRDPIFLYDDLKRRKERGEDVSGLREATLDHLVPVAYGGAEEMKNFVGACADCNIERARRKIFQDRKDERAANGTVERPDVARVVEKIPWRIPPDVPRAPCLVLTTHPSHWIIRLASVGLRSGQPVLIGKAGIVLFPDLWWCNIEDLTRTIDTHRGNR
jgi:hypothetical protein